MSLIQNRIKVRGIEYVVSELDAATMKHVRKMLQSKDENEKAGIEPYVAMQCCVEPKISMAEMLTLPARVVTKIANEAYRLSEDEEKEKND